MSLFDEHAAMAADITFALDGVDVTYQPPGGGSSIACVITLDIRDPDQTDAEGSPPAGMRTAQVRKSEIADPKANGTFTVDGGPTYRIASRPRELDAGGVVWVMWIERA